jgi:uncharacterized damage-inducible protein DinB
MDIRKHIKNNIDSSRRYLFGAMQDVTHEQFNWLPSDNSNPISSIYFHIASAEDFYLHRVIGGGALAFMTDGWSAKTGVGQIPGPRGGWDQFRAKQFDIAPIREYALMINAKVDVFVETVTNEELDREVSFLGGMVPVSFILNSVAVHMAFHTGEISLIKGLQGAKGIPF